MAVYEHLYGAYEGESHSARQRFLVIPRTPCAKFSSRICYAILSVLYLSARRPILVFCP